LVCLDSGKGKCPQEKCLFKSYYMLYVVETWMWTKAYINILTAAQIRFLRNTEENPKSQRIRNEKK
jgi:hypothetical protein